MVVVVLGDLCARAISLFVLFFSYPDRLDEANLQNWELLDGSEMETHTVDMHILLHLWFITGVLRKFTSSFARGWYGRAGSAQ